MIYKVKRILSEYIILILVEIKIIYKAKKNLLKYIILILVIIFSYFVYTKIIYDLLPYNEYISIKERKKLKYVLNNNFDVAKILLIDEMSNNQIDFKNHEKSLDEFYKTLENHKLKIKFYDNSPKLDKVELENKELKKIYEEYNNALSICWNKNKENYENVFELSNLIEKKGSSEEIKKKYHQLYLNFKEFNDFKSNILPDKIIHLINKINFKIENSKFIDESGE